jgi:hypothetical protein
VSSLLPAPLLLPLTLSLVATLPACGSSRPRNTYVPHPYAQAQQGAPNYAMPFAVPVPHMPASAAGGGAAAPASTAERDRCMAETGTAADCEAALRASAQAWNPTPGAATRDPAIYEVYRRACQLKSKLQGCAVFKSSAVGEADRPVVELLMTCEAGRTEACEDVQTKSNPLHAWLGTLKADWCKKGQSALCKSYRECRAGTAWSCRPATAPAGGGEVCGCAPKSCETGLTATAAARKWPDGTTRGVFTCPAPR